MYQTFREQAEDVRPLYAEGLGVFYRRATQEYTTFPTPQRDFTETIPAIRVRTPEIRVVD